MFNVVHAAQMALRQLHGGEGELPKDVAVEARSIAHRRFLR
jgi:hypothetical protein